ncbi:conserved hypothetical protein [Methanohalobium evestigatum Z-7303]|uniref:Uncharacterized protein n=1 Tax=Methanohalobium evestigatum (strain ATCC BAA-1072 / DSM 3721 / NBRC 107634 / OCM 161 / Z-7303) TaxID=644295 RepID=D7E662_METEZ|nr:hypothetical protein [Methanohalobium evestigatum]ADI73084.1 conserved hypothetical protein [Methanohalobium evestigatum Z-7303]
MSKKNNMDKKAASRIQSNLDKKGKDQEGKRRTQSSADRNAKQK